MAAATIRKPAREHGMAKVMQRRNLDIVLPASDASLISFSSCAGWPVTTLPVGNVSNNRPPWGTFVLSRV